MGLDHCYFIEHENMIIASVIISRMCPENDHFLLHALVIDKHYRKKGFAKRLLTKVCTEHHPIICFAKEHLSPLYFSANFKNIQAHQLTSLFKERFKTYQTKKTELLIFKC